MIRRFLLKKRWLIIVHSALMGTQKTKPSHTRKGEEDWRARRENKWLKKMYCHQFFRRERMLIFHHFKKHGPFVPCWSNCWLLPDVLRNVSFEKQRINCHLDNMEGREGSHGSVQFQHQKSTCGFLIMRHDYISLLLSLCLNKSNNRQRVATLGSRLWL